MVMAECDSAMVEKTGINLLGLMEKVARQIGANDVWGSRVFGRIVASTSLQELMTKCVAVVSDYLA